MSKKMQKNAENVIFSAFLYDLWGMDSFFYDDFILTCSFFVFCCFFMRKKEQAGYEIEVRRR